MGWDYLNSQSQITAVTVNIWRFIVNYGEDTDGRTAEVTFSPCKDSQYSTFYSPLLSSIRKNI